MLIDEKIHLFYELGFIRKNDHRIKAIRDRLEGKNRVQLDNWAHDIIVGNKSLDEAIEGGIK